MNNRNFPDKLICAVLAIFTALALSACAGAELHKTVFVSSMGISLKDGIYSASLYGEYAGGEEKKTYSCKASGRTPAEALNNAEREASVNIFLGHCEKIAMNAAALRDSAFLAGFSGSVVSPACRVYFSESPESAAEDIQEGGYEAELMTLSVSAKNGTPAVIPSAEDTSRIALITAGESVLLDSEDSFGIMLLRGEAFPRQITVASGKGFRTFRISPEAARRSYVSDGQLCAEITIDLGAEGGDAESCGAARELIAKICGEAYEKTVNVMGIDAVRLYSLTRYTEEELRGSKLLLGIRK